MNHLVFILFLFALGACVGSFLNVVVWRLPRGQSLVTPPSHCPKCEKPLAWYDNIPVFGWIMLRGKCRYCRQPISPRYPIVEFITGAIFVFYYAMYFIAQIGPCAGMDERMAVIRPMLTIQNDWPIYGLDMFLVSALLAASLIDTELFIIPAEIPWLVAVVGVIVHACIDTPSMPGALTASPAVGAMSAGAGVGLIFSFIGWARNWIPTSFPQGEPLLEVDREAVAREIEQARRSGEEAPLLPPPYTPSQIRAEMAKEMLFLLPPLIGGALALFLTLRFAGIGQLWDSAMAHAWFAGLLGAIFGSLVGAFTVWLTRILGTLAFGRVAMGLGDVHLMLGVGAVVGAGASVVAFFIAPFFGIILAVYLLITRTRRELPYGPYLSLATAAVLLFYCPIAAQMEPGLRGLAELMRSWFN